jgi:DNA-binding transcriptional regulator/RsmH inhibitor MraZ
MLKLSRMLTSSLLVLAVVTAASAGTLNDAVDAQVEIEQAAKRSQQKIDNLYDETASMVEQYRATLQQTASLKAYNDQLDKLVVSQQTELGTMEAQLRNVETTQRDIVPLMLKMIEVMAQFVELDAPFLPEERQARVVSLQAMMDRADVTLAEKYRRILEAYLVETEYGRTIEAYKGKIGEGEQSRTVNFLRIGRVALYYISLDGLETAYWNQDTKQWDLLPSDYRDSLSQALKVAKKQLPPDLLVLPVMTTEIAK